MFRRPLGPEVGRRSERFLNGFADWFASRGGIYQTTFVVGVWWFFEAVTGHANDITMLTVLTVYSAVTQPILAYCARRAAERADELMAAVKAEEDLILHEIQEIEHDGS